MENEQEDVSIKKKQWLFIALLILFIIIFSLFLKFKDYNEFVNNEIILTTADAFRYARWAEEVKNGIYGEIDYLINIPDYGVNQNPPPLLSLLAVWFSALFSNDINLFFVILPPILSIFFIIPLYFWLKSFISSKALLYVFSAGAMLGIFNMNYFSRTKMGYFDTDCLLLFFVFLILMLITNAIKEKENFTKSFGLVLLAGIGFKLFMWWYYLPLMGIFFIFSLTLGLFLYGHAIRDILLKTLTFVLIIVTPQFASEMFNFIYGYIFGAVMKQTDTIYADLFGSIQELQPVNFDQFVSLTTDNQITFIIGLIGILLLFIKYPKNMLIVTPFILTGLLSFKLGNRYTIYIAPFLGIGLGYMAYILFNYLGNRYIRVEKALVVGGIIFAIFITFPGQILHIKTDTSAYAGREFTNMSRLKEITEKNANILTWWDFGNPIEHLAQRATYINNAQSYIQKLYFIGKALMTPNEDEAKNIIAFITNNSAKSYINLIEQRGVSEILSAASSYNKNPSEPVYIYLTRYMLTFRLIHGVGLNNRDITEGKIGAFSCLNKCEPIKDVNGIFDCMSFAFNEKAKDTLVRNNVDAKKDFREIHYIDRISNKKYLISLNNESANPTTLHIIKSQKGDIYFTTASAIAKNSLLNRMFTLKEQFKNFELVYDDFPYAVVYKVR